AAHLRHGFRSPGIADLFLGDLSEAQIRESIERPTLRTINEPLRPPFDKYQFEFEPIVIDKMIEQLRQVAGTKLPTLHIVCSAVYDLVRKRPGPRKITLRDLDGVGGVEGSIESFLNTQLYNRASAANLTTSASDREAVRWKEALHGLARPQPDGTVTTDLKA